MFDIEVTQVDNFCKNELITVMFKLFDGKEASLVFFSNRNDNRICLFKMLNYIFVTMTELLVFCFCKSNHKLGFG